MRRSAADPRLGLPAPTVRLLMTADAVGGVWTYALDLAGGLARHGVQTTLAVFGPAPSADQRAEAAATPGLDLVETGLPLDWTASNAAEIELAAAGLRELARSLDADLVHLNSPALAAGGGFGPPVIGACHSCLATWWSAVRDGEMPADFRWRTHALWRGLIACDALIAPSAAFAEATARAYEVPRPIPVRNGRRPANLPPGERKRFVFTAGRLWDAGKNVGVLDAAAATIDAPVLAAGPLAGPTGERVELARAVPLGRISAEEVGRWLAHAPVFVSTALYEPFGLAVLEAAQAGCPLVLSDIATFRELWDGAALFVDPRDPDALSAAVRAALDDPQEAERLGAAARARAAGYTVEAMAAGALDAYRLVAPGLFLPTREAAA